MKLSVPRDKAGWSVLLLILLSVVVFYPGLSGDYMFDDTSNLLQNQALNMTSLDVASLQDAAESSGAGLLRRPVSMASFALNRYFFGIAPFSNKVTNLVIHILTGCLLYLFSRLLLTSYQRLHTPLTPVAERWLPVVVCGMWLVHPLNLTPVLYIVQRMTSLSALFTVAGLCLYVIGRLRMLDSRPGMHIILAGLFVMGGLALFSKENGVLLPLYMLAIELTQFRFRNAAGKPDKGILALFSLVVAVPAIVTLVYLATHNVGVLEYESRDFTMPERLLTESRVLLFYLRMIFLPTVQELGLFHDDFTISHGLLDPPSTLLSIITLVALFATAMGLLKKYPLVSLGILWFFAGHVLESTILPLEIAHEHRNYLADYGILLAASSALTQAPLRKVAPLIRIPVPLLFIMLFSYTTWLRSTQWSDNINQAIYEARHHPDSQRAVYSAGRIFARLALVGEPNTREQAFSYFDHARRLDKTGILPNVSLIKLSYLLDEPVKPEWFSEILSKLENYPISASDITSLQDLTDCTTSRCKIDPAAMEALFEIVMQKENARLVSIYGYYTINARGNFTKGLELFEHAVELDPKDPQYRMNLINLLIAMKRYDDARKQLELFKSADTHGNNENVFESYENDLKAHSAGDSTPTTN